ncbi:hypothetical protein D4S03_05140 [bacterium]|nr:MAG: hypothetical protein D4S03_05140 [bacterium]
MGEHMSDRDSKVLGFVASIPGTINMFCDGDSCVVAGSEKQMQDYIAAMSSDPKVKYRITKARYGHVVQAMKLGGAYSFDRESFSRLAPLVQQEGIDLVDFTPDAQTKEEGQGIPLMRLTWTYT